MNFCFRGWIDDCGSTLSHLRLPLAHCTVSRKIKESTSIEPFALLLFRSLAPLTHSLATLCLLYSHALLRSFVRSLPSLWGKGFCPGNESIDFIQFRPTVRYFSESFCPVSADLGSGRGFGRCRGFSRLSLALVCLVLRSYQQLQRLVGEPFKKKKHQQRQRKAEIKRTNYSQTPLKRSRF